MKKYITRNYNIEIHKKGMTLIELMVVVSIIVILILVIVAYLRTQMFKSNDARRKADMKRISIAVEEYEKDKNCYPLPSLVVCNPGTGLLPYSDKIPCDPVTKASYMYEHQDAVCPTWYRLYSSLENNTDVDYEPAIGPNGAYSYVYSSPNAPAVVSSPPATGDGGGGGGDPQIDFYGCFSGTCTLIQWDPLRPGPSCDPNFQNSNCYEQCSSPLNECQAWN